MATLASLRQDVRGLIGGMAFDRLYYPAGSWAWTDDGINWGCDQVAALLGLTRLDVIVSVTSKLAVIPTDAIKVVDCLGRTGTMGKVLLKSTMQIEDRKDPNWKSRTGEPTVWIENTGSTIYVNGDPAIGGILVGYIQRPTVMVADIATPDPRIPEYFHQYLKYAAAAYLLMLTGQGHNPEKAAKFFQDFTTGIGIGPLPLASVSVQR